MPTSASGLELLALYAHLTPRDRTVLAQLDDHQVLTTSQIHRLHYRGLRTCQIRLRGLHQMGILDRFRFARPAGGTDTWHWVLGLNGARFRAGATGRHAPTDRTHRDRILRLSARPDLAHLIATNEFAVRLTQAARNGGTCSLDRWWSERTATAKFLQVRPDAHGVWTAGRRSVGWFLETDMGTESVPRLVAKLDAYTALAAATGIRYPVLFWLPTDRREAHLQQALRAHLPRVPVATATHASDPAGAVWLPADSWQRLTLARLPNDHGRHSAGNPNWIDGALDLTGQRANPA